MKHTLEIILTVLLLAPLAALHAAESPVPTTYDEPHRPQFHFTPPKGWLNDPVAMFHHAGEYHLHYLGAPDKPNGKGWGDTWIHLVSKDVLRWEALAPSVAAEKDGTIGGGSVVVDERNLSGFQTGNEKAVVLFYNTMKRVKIPEDGFVAGPRRQDQMVSLAYSNDRGRTWTPYSGNPFLKPDDGNWHFRDPSVFWHEASQQWIMLVCRGYTEFCDIFASSDLKAWKRVGKAPNGEEPRIFQLPVRGTGETKWLFLGGDYPMTPPQLGGKYFIGDFDGKNFTPESGARRLGGNHFVGHSFANLPAQDGRQIWMGWKWLRDEGTPGPWTGGPLTIPAELTLGKDPEGQLCLFYSPAKELQSLRGPAIQLRDQTIDASCSLLTDQGIRGELFEWVAEFQLDTAKEFGLEFRKGPEGGFTVGYDVKGRKRVLRDPTGAEVLSSQRLLADRGRVKLHLLLDRSLIDIFGHGGLTWNCAYFEADAKNQGVELYARQGSVTLLSMELWSLKSIWK
ncbi:MAG TPA: glycoside hydrolase family 32 protein [Thermoguttaceae bacterium]|nr:glycoside hydrolase family 32 protein [Thermoguttaceae bacterium]HUU98284.1 glycoside hydrolase family 32 protein [Phycisphaerae bacterium]